LIHFELRYKEIYEKVSSMQKRKFNSSTIQKLRLNKIEDLEKKLAIQKSPEPSILIELIEVYIKLSDKNKKDILKKHLFSLEESLQSSKQEHQLSEEATGHLSSLFNKASNSDNSEEIVCYGVLLLKCCRMKKERKYELHGDKTCMAPLRKKCSSTRTRKLYSSF
jgi:hypothetical protein